MEKMEVRTKRNLKLFFSRTFRSEITGGVEIFFREKGYSFSEKGAVYTDRTACDGLSVGDWCFLPESYGFSKVNYEFRTLDSAYVEKYIMNLPRIILAFFELEAKLTSAKRPVIVRRIFCATGVIWVKKSDFEERAWGWVPDQAKITVEGSPINPIKVDTLNKDGRCYAKLFQADLLKRYEKEDLFEESKKS